MKRLTFFKIRSFSQRKVFWGIIIVALAILIYYLGAITLSEMKKRIEDEIALKKRVLVRYQEYLQHRNKIEEELEESLRTHEMVQMRLIPGENPQLGAANLQEIVKKISEKNNISIRSFRMLEPKEMNIYRRISIQIDFNPINSMLNLGQFIYDIENYEKDLMISEMDLLVFNPRMPHSIQGNLVISGLMKGVKFKERGKEG